MLKIGAQPSAVNGFDLICYDDAIQFSMETCEPLANTVVDIGQFRLRILYCLRVLHSFGLIHKDVKPDNMAYSPLLKDFVFLDFGVSQYVQERPGEKTLTFREGTFTYMSAEMKQVGAGEQGMVDLFWNDLSGLEKSVEAVEINKKSQQESSLSHQFSRLSFEDELFPALWRAHTEKASLSAAII